MKRDERGTADDLFRAIVPGFALLLSIVPLARFWAEREYTHDDFYLAYLAWIRSTDLVAGRHYMVPNFTPLAEFSAPLFGAFHESLKALDFLRLPMLVAALALIGLTFQVARQLSGSFGWGLAAAAVVSWHPQVVLRITDVRTDPLAAALVLLATVLLLGERRRAFTVGLCAGLAAVLSPKMALAVPFLAIATLLGKTSFLQPAVRFGSGASVAPLIYFAVRIGVDGWTTVRSVFSGLGGAVGDAPAVSRFSLLWEIAAPVPGIAALILIGGVLLAIPQSSPASDRRGVAYAILSLSFAATFVALNPALYAYNALILVPLMAPLVAGIPSGVRRIQPHVVETGALGLVTVLAVVGGLGAMTVALSSSNAAQRNTLAWMWESTAADERVFDWQGMHFGRQGIYHWWTYKGMLPAYYRGNDRLLTEWQRAPVTLVLNNYRLGWLAPEDARFLRDNFVPIGPCALVPGRVVSGAELARGTSFDVFAGGLYETAPPGAPVLIDGNPAGDRLRLEPGKHHLRAAGGAPPFFGIRYVGSRKRLPPCGPDPLLRPFPLHSSRGR